MTQPIFQGTTLASLDDKGRLAVPKRFREALFSAGGLVVAARHPDGCLVLYPADAWAAKREALAALPYSARAFVRFVLGSAAEIKADAAGRLLIPAGLRALAGLEGAVVLVGLGGHFELWDRGRFDAAEEKALEAGLDAADFSF